VTPASVPRALLYVLGFCALGCSEILGIEDWHGETADADDARGDAGPDASPSCDGCGAEGCTCAPPPPEGWFGPTAMNLGPDPAGCAPPSGQEVLAGGVGVPFGREAVCGACACGPPAASCPANTSVALYTQSLCGGGSISVDVSVNGVCHSVGPVDGLSFLADVAPTQTPCAPSGGSPAVSLAAWPNNARLCALGGGPGCAGGGTCAPRPGDARSPCIHRVGDVACPEGPYAERTVVYADVSDTRGCSSCDCGAPIGGTCSAIISFYSDDQCMQWIMQDAPDGTCHTFTGANIGGVKLAPQAALPGTCSPTGGDAIGAVEGSEPTTVCCM